MDGRISDPVLDLLVETLCQKDNARVLGFIARQISLRKDGFIPLSTIDRAFPNIPKTSNGNTATDALQEVGLVRVTTKLKDIDGVSCQRNRIYIGTSALYYRLPEEFRLLIEDTNSLIFTDKEINKKLFGALDQERSIKENKYVLFREKAPPCVLDANNDRDALKAAKKLLSITGALTEQGFYQSGGKSISIMDLDDNHVLREIFPNKENLKDYVIAVRYNGRKLPHKPSFYSGTLILREFRATQDAIAVKFAQESYGLAVSEIRERCRQWITVDMLESFIIGGRGHRLCLALYRRNKEFWTLLQPVDGFSFTFEAKVSITKTQ